MSRIGRKPISIPAGVNLEIGRSEVVVKGPKGELRTPLPEGITVRAENSVAVVERSGDSRSQRMFHGLTRSLLANAIKGVSEGFSKELEIVGVGYKAEHKGDKVIFQLGYSHPIEFSIPKGISIQVEGGTKLTVSGIDKQLVGQVAANIRSLRKPDVYKGKGIRYKGEVLRRKVGKAGVGGQ
ncbi:MAG: 50S ribosomal protein L6 [Acidobacteria bacterium]|nr:50S ribosomal protein L6 [Acidobacteriota bacterium]